jgi:hypothetical protein
MLAPFEYLNTVVDNQDTMLATPLFHATITKTMGIMSGPNFSYLGISLSLFDTTIHEFLQFFYHWISLQN